MDDHLSGALLVLRRYIAAPVPGTALRLCGLFAMDEHRLRLRLTDDSAGTVALDLPTALAEEHGVRWYATALRHAAGWMTEQGMPRAGSGPEERIDGTALLDEQDVLPHEPEDTTEDTLDYLIGDLIGDPLWHARTASTEPQLYTLLGFDTRAGGVVRLYLRHHDGRVIGVDVSTRSRRTDVPRGTGLWWPAAKLIAVLNPGDHATLAAHRVRGAHDPHCEAVYDLTRWL
jgi:hypothetical protein